MAKGLIRKVLKYGAALAVSGLLTYAMIKEEKARGIYDDGKSCYSPISEQVEMERFNKRGYEACFGILAEEAKRR